MGLNYLFERVISVAFIDVIKYEGSSDVLIFRHPIVDFNNRAQLIVHEKQEAIVFMNGEAKTLYTPGKYELTSKNLPGVKHIVALFSGGELANHCEVYFINKLLFSNIPWVTSAMDIQDHTIGNYYSFWAQGFFTVRVANSADLFEIIGNGEYLTTDGLKELFKERITSAAREVLSIAMNQENLSYGEINSHLTSLSDRVMAKVHPAFEKVGLLLDEFRFDSVNMNKDAEFDKHRSHLGERSGQQIEGYTYDKKRMYDAMEAQAKNQGGAGAAAGMMTGAGFGIGMGQVYSGMVGNAANSAFGSQHIPSNGGSNNGITADAGVVIPHQVNGAPKGVGVCSNCQKPLEDGWVCCPYCGTDIVADRFCPACGAKLPSNPNIKFCPVCRTILNKS